MIEMLVNQKIPGHVRGQVVELEEMTPFFEQHVAAGNVLPLGQPERKNAGKADEAPKAKGRDKN